MYLNHEPNFYKYENKHKKWKKENSYDGYKGLPSRARGGVVDNHGVTWFFNGI